MKLYINGELTATTSPFEQKEYDVSNDQPLRIGFGEMDYFSGKIGEVRVYNRALDDKETGRLSSDFQKYEV